MVESLCNEIGTKTETRKENLRKSLKTRFIFISITRSVDFDRQRRLLRLVFYFTETERVVAVASASMPQRVVQTSALCDMKLSLGLK